MGLCEEKSTSERVGGEKKAIKIEKFAMRENAKTSE